MSKRATKKAERSKDAPPAYAAYLSYLQSNWKTALIIGLAIVLMVYMKVAEEMSSELYGKQSDEDLYAILELRSSATVKDVKRQYNKLVLEYHPDKNPNCTMCEEKMGRITKAYEVLSSPEAKKHYDQTNGILEPIKSNTQSLHKFNYQRLVEESPKPWVIQVYRENSGSCKSFSGFWEEFAAEYSYLNFGRVNYSTQGAIVHKMPFAVDELPLVVSLVPGQTTEAFVFHGDRSPNALFRTFIKNSMGHAYRNITEPEFGAQLEKRSSKRPGLFLLGTDNISPFWQYIAYYYKKNFDTYRTNAAELSQVHSRLKNDVATLVVRPPKSVNAPIRVFDREPGKATLAAILRYGFFLSVPGGLSRDLQVLVFGLLHRLADLC